MIAVAEDTQTAGTILTSVSHFTFPLTCTSGQMKLMISFFLKINIYIYITLYVYLFISVCECFSRVLLNPYLFSNPMECGSKNHCIGSGQSCTLKQGQGTRGQDPGTGTL